MPLWCDHPDASWSLPEASECALRMVQWLRRCHVPAENIEFLTGASRAPVMSAGTKDVSWRQALSGNLRDALKKLKSKDADLILVYWMGHGGEVNGDMRLFLPEMTEEHGANLSYQELIRTLELDSYAKARKVVIADACREIRTDFASSIELLKGKEVAGYYCAVRSVPRGKLALSTGFSRALLGQLESESLDWNFPKIFAKVKEACPEVTITLRDWEEGEVIRQGKKRSLPANAEHWLDRDLLATQFKRPSQRVLRERKQSPVICMVCGDPEDKPDSLVERLMLEIQGMAGSRPKPVLVPWDGGEEEGLRAELAEGLGELCEPIEAEGLARVLRSRGEPFYQIHHQITKWRPGSGAALETYVRFWTGLRDHDIPPVFVYFEADHLESRTPAMWEWLLRRKQDSFEEAVERVRAGLECHWIPPRELEPINRGHARAFLRRYYPGGDVDGVIDAMFGEKQELRMKKAQRELRRALDKLWGGKDE